VNAATSATETQQTTQATVAETTTPAEGSESGAEKPDQSQEQQQPKRKSWRDTAVQLREQRRQLRQENARLREENERLSKPLVKDTDGLDYDQRERLRVREALREDRIEDNRQRASSLREQDQQIRDQEIEASHNELFNQLGAATDRFPGLTEKITRINLSQDTVEYLADSDMGAELANHLVAHPETADRLFDLTNPKVATPSSLREADRLMARLEASIQKPTARKATTAPNPGTTLNGATTPSAASLSELAKKEDASAYIKAREAQWKSGAR